MCRSITGNSSKQRNRAGQLEESADVQGGLLRAQDVCAAYRLIGENRDLGGDPALWFPRMCEGLCRLSAPRRRLPARDGGGAARSYRADLSLPVRPHRSLLRAVLATCALTRSRPIRSIVHCSKSPTDSSPGVDGRSSPTLCGTAPPCSTSISGQPVSTIGSFPWAKLERGGHQRDRSGSAIGDRFAPREQRLLHFFHGELGCLIGHSLVSATEPSPEKLSRRLRQTLACLWRATARSRSRRASASAMPPRIST